MKFYCEKVGGVSGEIGESKHKLVIVTDSNIKLLAAMRTWGMDGTFKVVPQWYQQLFTIHAFVAGKLVPAVYCLCTGKDIKTYGYIFQALMDKAAALEVDLNPETIIYRKRRKCWRCSKVCAEHTGSLPSEFLAKCCCCLAGIESKHILVIATGSNIRLLAAMQTWGIDGTFKVVPQWYQQLFTIHAFVASKLVPAVYCLCTGKDIKTYGYIFQALMDKAAALEVDLNPETIICDFETALIPAIRGYFPNTRVQGCYFHFCQAVHRKVGELGLKARYRTEEPTKRKIRMLLATAFLPVLHVNTGVSLLEAGTTGNLLALFQYFRQERKFSFFVLFVAFVMSVVPELRLVPNCCGGMSLVHEGRVYKLKRAARKKYWRCSKDKKGCGGAIWTNLDVTAIIKRNDHIESCPVDEHLAYKMEKKAILKKRSAEETKPIPAIYDEEAAAASADPSTSGHFPLFKRVQSTMYNHRAKRYPKLPSHRQDLQIPAAFRTTKAGDDFLLWQSSSRHILVFATGSNIRLLAAMRTWGMDGTFKVVPQWYN
ncbi:hypothetical protein T08_4538 [Trichinella sp. T8]|nr:hypothetical protein T08_4538 [Trichinella sp. T8]